MKIFSKQKNQFSRAWGIIFLWAENCQRIVCQMLNTYDKHSMMFWACAPCLSHAKHYSFRSKVYKHSDSHNRTVCHVLNWTELSYWKWSMKIRKPYSYIYKIFFFIFCLVFGAKFISMQVTTKELFVMSWTLHVWPVWTTKRLKGELIKLGALETPKGKNLSNDQKYGCARDLKLMSLSS